MKTTNKKPFRFFPDENHDYDDAESHLLLAHPRLPGALLELRCDSWNAYPYRNENNAALPIKRGEYFTVIMPTKDTDLVIVFNGKMYLVSRYILTVSDLVK